jgi:small subunit ribosomal protein S9
MDEYFGWSTWQRVVTDAFQVTGTLNRFRVVAKVIGGGVNAQAEAIRHGITRALIVFDPDMKPALRRAGFVTRDARIKESKKYGLKRARRAPQYTKR